MRLYCVLLCCLILFSFSDADVKDLAWKWGERAFEICKKLSKKDTPKVLCDNYQTVVEETFDSMGVQMAGVVGNSSLSEVYDRAETEPWKSAGISMLHEVARVQIRNKVTSPQQQRRDFDAKFLGWMLKLANKDTSVGGLPAGFDPSLLAGIKKGNQDSDEEGVPAGLPPDFDPALLKNLKKEPEGGLDIASLIKNAKKDNKKSEDKPEEKKAEEKKADDSDKEVKTEL